MSATDTPRRTTGHPAKDSGGGAIWHVPTMARRENAATRWWYKHPSRWTAEDFDWQERWYAFFCGDGPLPIPPDDYDRHWDLEGPHA